MSKHGVCDACGNVDIVGYVACIEKELCPKCGAEVFGSDEARVRAMLEKSLEPTESRCDCCEEVISPEDVGETKWWYEPSLHSIVCACPRCQREGRRPKGADN